MAPPISALSSASGVTAFSAVVTTTKMVTLRSGLRMEYDVFSPPPGRSNGKSVIMLHGFPLDKDEWAKVAPKLAEQGYTIYTPNLRGYGRTDRPGFEKSNETLGQAAEDVFDKAILPIFGVKPKDRFKDYSLPTLVQDVKDFSDALGLQKPDLVGHDWGAIITDAVASKYSASFRKIARFNGSAAEAYKHERESLELWITTRYKGIFNTPIVGEQLGKIADYGWLKTTLSLESPGTFSSRDFDRMVAQLQQPGVLSARMAYYKELQKALDEGTVPPSGYNNQALIVSSEKDIYVRPKLMSADKAKIPNATNVTIPGSHWSTVERPNQVSNLLIDFLGKP